VLVICAERPNTRTKKIGPGGTSRNPKHSPAVTTAMTMVPMPDSQWSPPATVPRAAQATRAAAIRGSARAVDDGGCAEEEHRERPGAGDESQRGQAHERHDRDQYRDAQGRLQAELPARTSGRGEGEQAH